MTDQRLGRYELLTRLGSGGMAEVHLARLSGPGGFEKLLVIKRLLPQVAGDEAFVSMFLREARLAANLSHRNVAQIYEMGELDGSYYLAMEYVRGRNLRDVLLRVAIDPQVLRPGHVIDIAAQICSALAYAHNANDAAGQPLHLIHRDINPRNILLSYAGEVKLIDFGIAKSTVQQDSITGAGTVKGKLAYMSPEQASGRRLDKRSDIFAVGVCVYELCAHRNPFAREDPILTYDAIQRLEPESLTRVAPAFAALDPIVMKAMAKDPRQRYDDCGQILRDLDRVTTELGLDPAVQTVADAMRVLFADSIVEDESALRRLVSESESGRGLAWVPSYSTSHAVSASTHAGRPRLRLVVALAVVAGVTAIGSSGLYGLGRRHAAAPPAAQATKAPVIEPPPPAAVDEPPRPSEPAQPSRPTQTPASAAARYGSLNIMTSPRVAIRLGDSAAGHSIKLSRERGTLHIGEGTDPLLDPFEVEVGYQVAGRTVRLAIDAEPWAVVQDGDGVALGKTPFNTSLGPSGIVLELVHPKQGRVLKLAFRFQP